MKTSIFVILALIIGLVVGSFNLKSDLRKAQKEIESLKKELAARSQRQSSMRNITSLLRIPEPTPVSHPVTQPATNSAGPVTEAAGTETGTNETRRSRHEDRKSFEEGIKQAVELWKTRSEVARNGFLTNISATPVQTQMFDQIVDTMNKQLAEKIKQWADYLKQQQEVTPESGMRMMHDLGGTVISAYDELDRVLPTGWRDQAGEKFQLFDFVNPEVAMPLTEVEGKLGRGGHFP